MPIKSAFEAGRHFGGMAASEFIAATAKSRKDADTERLMCFVHGVLNAHAKAGVSERELQEWERGVVDGFVQKASEFALARGLGSLH